MPTTRLHGRAATLLLLGAALLVPTGPALAQAAGDTSTSPDPRSTLAAGWMDAAYAGRGVERVGGLPKPAGFTTAQDPGDFSVWNTDLAFRDNDLFVGSYNGFQIYDVSNPAAPRLAASVVCPGGQGDMSVYGNLLFMSVEENRGRTDCGTTGVADSVSTERFRGVRILDISDLRSPRQVALVQTCRGSHTHTVVTSPRDRDHVWIYVSGTGGVRSPSELEGCSTGAPEEDPNTSRFRIEVIRVPLASPGDARVVAEPRIFADQQTGAIAGLWRGGAHGEGTQRTSETDQCHDITVYPAMGLAAGACSGNGILLDVSDPENPRRITEVVDPNFAYWHSATFNNDASKVLFTDEWGGGTQPRCRASDPPTWGANAIFSLQDGEMTLEGYYKLPAAQGATENCVAHNGSLVPVPGRDIMAQAWYQGGLSVLDFTDAAHPVELAFFDRGPLDAERLRVGGYWSTYWHNGHIYASEMARGLDVFRLVPTDQLSANEIEAAGLARYDVFNPQSQPQVTWPAAYPVARALVDQLERGQGLDATRIAELRDALDRAEAGEARSALGGLATRIEADAATAGAHAKRMRMLAETLQGLAGA